MVKSGQFSPTRRFIRQRFGWSPARRNRLASCPLVLQEGVAYEPDALMWEGGGYYFGAFHQAMSISNMPDSYIDTQAGDVNYRTWTIGMGNVSHLHGGRWYFTRVRTAFGGSSTDQGTILGQRLTNYCPSSPGWAWCISSPDDRVIGIRPYDVPNVNWQWWPSL
jgi:hypothetical protein